MKKTFFLIIVLICFVFTFVGCSSNDNSFNMEIDDNKINNRLLYNKISNAVNKEYLKDVFADDFENQYESVILSENYIEIEKSLVEDLAIINCCKEIGIFVDKNSATEYAESQFNKLKIDDSQKRYASILVKVLSQNELSEEEYLNLLCEESFYKYNRQALYKFFQENLYKETDKTLDEQFDVYVNTLLKK